MPNWITNRLTINTDGDDSMIEKILSEVRSEDSLFDFNKIVLQKFAGGEPVLLFQLFYL